MYCCVCSYQSSKLFIVVYAAINHLNYVLLCIRLLSIVWILYCCVCSYLVDNTVIRIFRNLKNLGLAYPASQQTQAFSALFDGSDWATQGGKVPINFAGAPFVASYGSFQLDACINNGVDVTACQTNYQNNWWEGPAYTALSSSQISNLQYIRKTYLVYDYCTDVARNPVAPVECAYNYNT